MLGVPAYGYVSRSERRELASRGEGPGPSDGDRDVGNSMEMSTVEVKGDDGGSDAGQIQFNQLVAQGALVRNSGGEGGGYSGAGGF